MRVFTIDDLTQISRDRFLRGEVEIYDLTNKHFNDSSRKIYTDYKWKGYSMAFKYKERTKLLVYGRK